MSLPSLTKTWLFSNNNTTGTFVSLNDTMAQVLFSIKNFLVATVGWTVKYTCDGTTGPTSSSDHTDRIASKANCTTRGAAVTNANSFFVLTDGNGVDFCCSYVGATDDICRISYSASGVYTPAGTSNQTPTATDEVLIVNATSLINNTASLNRIWHMQASSDLKLFRFWLYRNSVGIIHFKTEQVTSVVTAMGFSPAYMTWQSQASH